MVNQTVKCELCTITGVILRGGGGMGYKQNKEMKER